MNKATGAFIFLAGVAAGAVGTWFIIKKKYEELADAEIASVKEAYGRRTAVVLDETSSESNDKDKPDLMTFYKDKIKDEGYTNYSEKPSDKSESEEDKKMKKPHVISYKEFEESDFESIPLTYYADNVLADDDDEVINNVDEIIGNINVPHEFGDDDCIYVANDKLKTVYEICRDRRKYSEIPRPKSF